MEPSSDVVPDITCKDLFFAFFGVGINSFGGVLPWARRMLLEQRRWLSEREFAEVLGLGQVLSGPNVVNLSIMIGARFRGAKGALSTFSGLMLAPLLIVLSLATILLLMPSLLALHAWRCSLACVRFGCLERQGCLD